MMNKKGGMGMMNLGPMLGGFVIGLIVGLALMAYLANHGILDPSMIPI